METKSGAARKHAWCSTVLFQISQEYNEGKGHHTGLKRNTVAGLSLNGSATLLHQPFHRWIYHSTPYFSGTPEGHEAVNYQLKPPAKNENFILSDPQRGISVDTFIWHIFWHSIWRISWHSIWHILSGILSAIPSDICSNILSGILSDSLCGGQFIWHSVWVWRGAELASSR